MKTILFFLFCSTILSTHSIAIDNERVNSSTLDTTQSTVKIITLDQLEAIVTKSPKKYVLLEITATWCSPCVKDVMELIKRKKEFDALNVELVFLFEKNSKIQHIEKLVPPNYRSFIVNTKGKKPKQNMKEIGLKLFPDLNEFYYSWPLSHFALVDKNMNRLLHHDPVNDSTDILLKIKELNTL
ncbi:peroxiredoxin family protein [Flammeovirga kamogawensis]|uniref:Redoxin domain-containing protein n=1 Tax=Flammeovirga kamogawensis TaxID=373891 RepID=A0ABX8H5C6_9BACT|nr:redoxin domain-containing protein [Flammeovirga kamogawensis]MBB6461706.1 thiol-disulfide isomerase/thioredoxin [Flammeovirga kamogawensis]QWG10626.1 redoxin domain-containing protein [Flammeovirga kamogawensis]TRX63731.1 redoxin domain-containing protein [Flammeovirga kamogawensis]